MVSAALVAPQVMADRKGSPADGAGEGPVMVMSTLMLLQVTARGK
jgi:hypothetical protein